MNKPTVTKTWITGLIMLVAGLAVGGISMALMRAYGGDFMPAASGNGQDFVPSMDSAFWTTLSFAILGFTAAVAGGIVQLAAWIGALLNTYLLADKTWFVVLLLGGLFSVAFGVVGFAVMVAYLIGGPDGRVMQRQPQLPVSAPPPATFAHTA
jgi:hypothetical protein